MRKTQERPQPTQHRNLPLINLSSSDQSDSDNDKENHCNDSIHTAPHTVKHNPKSPPFLTKAPINVNQNQTSKVTNLMQFSTLSLDEGSVGDIDQQIKILMMEKKELEEANQTLKGQNSRLRSELNYVSKQALSGDLERSYEERLEQCYAEIQHLKAKNKKMQQELRRTQKQYENRLINQELPTKKTITEENTRIYRELVERIKEACNSFIQKLSKEKMNANVQTIISDHVNELLHLSPPSSNNSFAKYNSSKSTLSITPSRYSKMTHPTRQNNDTTTANISSDYRLLQKSIEKLKAMEKEIDSRTPPYLKRQQQEEPSMNRSILDQSSLSCLERSNLDKSKSKRKRIFQ